MSILILCLMSKKDFTISERKLAIRSIDLEMCPTFGWEITPVSIYWQLALTDLLVCTVFAKFYSVFIPFRVDTNIWKDICSWMLIAMFLREKFCKQLAIGNSSNTL